MNNLTKKEANNCKVTSFVMVVIFILSFYINTINFNVGLCFNIFFGVLTVIGYVQYRYAYLVLRLQRGRN